MAPTGIWLDLFVPNKSKLIIKHSKNSGIPLDRMVFVGDNNTDYGSAKLLNVFFIEARVVGKKYGTGSLITYKDGDEPVYIESYTDGKLLEILDTRNNELKKSKWHLKRDFL